MYRRRRALGGRGAGGARGAAAAAAARRALAHALRRSEARRYTCGLSEIDFLLRSTTI